MMRPRTNRNRGIFRLRRCDQLLPGQIKFSLVPSFLFVFFAAGVILASLLPDSTHSARAQESTVEATSAEKLFALDVLPIFKQKCFGCHGEKPDELKSGFDLRSREALLQGGESYGEDVVMLSDPDSSAILAMVDRSETGFEMPPKESEKLSDEEVESLREWIQGGAPWPNEERVAEIYREFAEGIPWKTSGGLSEDWTERKYQPSDLWAYQPLRTDFPVLQGSSAKLGNKNPVDRFVESRWQNLKVPPAPRASRRTLIRRLTFDLLGLPPQPADVDAFVNDPRSDQTAYLELVDRLLQSPHYGEQAARRWLDVGRYADSSGFANDWERPNAWRYRDYVVRAFNNDKPYDEFVREQIAGDELAANLEESSPLKNPRAAELLIAAGFLRMGPWEHTGMSVARVTRQQFLDDVTDSVGQVFLAHALQCCRCHDHKFDPVPTRDYYSIQSVFATTQFADVDTMWLPNENLSGMAADKAYKEKKLKANQAMLKQLNQRSRQYEAEWFKQKGLPYKSVAEARKAKVSKSDLPPRKVGWTPDDYGQERIGRKWATRLRWELDRYEPIAFTVINGKTITRNSNQGRIEVAKNPFGRGTLEETKILLGGDIGSPTEPVKPGVLSAIKTAQVAHITPDPIGRRLRFANWLTDPENPLPARVMANRIWQWYFGRGIAGNPNNFGSTGKKPTHPELLDYLASKFIENQWSVKKLTRMIVTSEAYCRSSDHPEYEKLAEFDPDNQSYARFLRRRLTAEELRDAQLAASGELNPRIGGIPSRPDMNLEAALQPRMIMGTFAPAYVPNPKPDQRNRRSLYSIRLRGHRDPFFETFNQPGSEKSCELRDRSMVTTQALTMLNSEESLNRAVALAMTVFDEAKKTGATEKELRNEVVRRLFSRVYQRVPTDAEQKTVLSAWERLSSREPSPNGIVPQYPTEVVRTANEENTGQPFQFAETLFEYRDYVPDPNLNLVDAETRGLAGVCLALLNSNEFVFVD